MAFELINVISGSFREKLMRLLWKLTQKRHLDPKRNGPLQKEKTHNLVMREFVQQPYGWMSCTWIRIHIVPIHEKLHTEGMYGSS